MGLTVNRQTVKKITVNRQLIQAKLAVKGLEYLLSRTIMASNNGVKQTISLYIRTGTFPNIDSPSF